MRLSTFISRMAIFVIAVGLGIGIVHFQWFPYAQWLEWRKAVAKANEPPAPRFSSYYHRQVSQHKMLPEQDYDIVFLGDSLTDEMDWAAFYADKSVANLGIGGDTSDGVIHRLDTVLNLNPKTLFLMIGINDLLRGRTTESAISHYQTLLPMLADTVPQIYLQSLLPVGSELHHLNGKVVELNRQLQLLAQQYDNVTYIDLHSLFSINEALNPDYTNDSVHLTNEGYQLWLNVIAPYIDASTNH